MLQIEMRKGTSNRYIVETLRVDGMLQRRYLGKASDPVAHLLLEYDQLARAQRLADQEQWQADKENQLDIANTLKHLAQWSAQWKVLYRIGFFEMHKKRTNINKTERVLPKLHRFNQVCRDAASGDESAQRQLDIWIEQVPQILDDATDLIGLARDQLTRLISDSDEKCRVLWEKQIDEKTCELLGDSRDHPLTRMFAEVTVLAWLDVKRSSIMPYIAGGDMKKSSFWGDALSRSQRQWTTIAKSYEQHLKAMRKSQSPGASTRAK